jgi:hypothetical protein
MRKHQRKRGQSKQHFIVRISHAHLRGQSEGFHVEARKRFCVEEEGGAGFFLFLSLCVRVVGIVLVNMRRGRRKRRRVRRRTRGGRRRWWWSEGRGGEGGKVKRRTRGREEGEGQR